MKQFERLTKYLNVDTDYEQTADLFTDDVYAFAEGCAEYELCRYMEILEEYGFCWDYQALLDADVSGLSARCILAMIMCAVRAQRFCDGMLQTFFESGAVHRWLARLQELDEAQR